MSSNEDVLAELRRIRELLEHPPPPPPTKGLIAEFKAFLSQYKVLALAVGFVFAIYLGGLVKALVSDFILPIVSYALPPGTNINTYMAGPFGVGDFANALITFLVVAFVIFIMVKAAKRFNIE